MKPRNRGFTLIELVVALVLSVIVVEIAWKMLTDQKSNMVGIRQRLRAQAVAREALKTMESEIRIAGFGQQFAFSTTTGRIDSLDGSAGLSVCPGMQDANGSSVIAIDGLPDKSDTLTVAYPTVVSPTTGTDCGQIQWSRYFVNGSADLMRVTASTLVGLDGAGAVSSIVAKGVDVFQIRLGVMGGGNAPASLLTAGTQACCANLSFWTTSGGTQVQAGANIKISPALSSNWSFLSVTKVLKAGERWRDTLFIEPNSAFFTDVKIRDATLSAGLFSSLGAPVATVNLLTIPDNDQALSVAGSGLFYSIDLVVPADGSYKLGLQGVSKTTSGTSLRVQSMNAIRVGMAPGAQWWKNPSAMAATEWSGVKQVEVIVLSRAESMDETRASSYTGLANFVQGAGVAGEFKATDKQVRSVFDHIYPVGNNGAN